ncbi:DUF4382 domain-containing protein [Natronorarus salvus]|uniref:DUF4382 domain-containing protein n=1 Tax=Natronorarus salvus TaxID=3117733 RepID=UPI002F2604A6
MRRRTYIERTGLVGVGLSGVLAGCLGTGDPEHVGEGGEERGGTDDRGDEVEGGSDGGDTPTGTFATAITDQPGDIDDFESCVVTVTGAYVLPGGTSGGRDETGSDADDTAEEDGTDDEAVNDEGSNGAEDDGWERLEDDAVDDGSEGGGGSGEKMGDDDETDDYESGGGEESEDDGAVDGPGSGRLYLEFDEPQEADLVDLQGTNTQLVDEREIDVGSYGGLHLVVEDVRGTLVDGEVVEVDTPGNAGLKFPETFEIRENERTTFVADFTPVRRGRTNRYLIRPVATGTAVLYGDEEYDGGEDGEDYSTEPDEIEGSEDGSDGPDDGPEGDDGGDGVDGEEATGGDDETGSDD